MGMVTGSHELGAHQFGRTRTKVGLEGLTPPGDKPVRAPRPLFGIEAGVASCAHADIHLLEYSSSGVRNVSLVLDATGSAHQ